MPYPMKSKEIYKMVQTETGLNLMENSRKRPYIYARGIANALCKEFTNDSLSAIASLSGKTHASVLNSIREFYNTYSRYSEYHRNIYLKVRDILLGIRDTQIKEQAERQYAEAIGANPKNLIEITHKYLEVKSENESLQYLAKKKKEDFEKELFEKNPLIKLVSQVPPEKHEAAYLRIETMLKMLVP
jgi:hypothetical protein